MTKNVIKVRKMKEYIMLLVGVAVFCGIVEVIAPSGRADGLKKHIKLASSLCVLAILVAPLGELIGSIREWRIGEEIIEANKDMLLMEYEEIYNNTLENFSADSVAQRCKVLLSDTFGVEEDKISVRVIFSSETEGKVEQAIIQLSFEAVAVNPHDMKKYISELLDCECEIIYV
jgi:hypothetical protein